MALAPPYQLGKGPIAVALEQFLALRDNAVGLVGNLEAKGAFGDNPFVRHLAAQCRKRRTISPRLSAPVKLTTMRSESSAC